MTMKFAWRIIYIPAVLTGILLCVILSLQLVKPTVQENQEVEDFSYLLRGMTLSSNALNSSVHIAVVVNNATSLFTLMKSVLIYRHSRIHFHFVFIDELVEKTILTFMKSWPVANVLYSSYSLSELKKNTSWLPNDNFLEASNDIVKLHLPTILPQYLDRVILLDTDLIMTADMWPIWNLFLQPEIKQKAMAVSRSNSLDGKHFDGAIILYNLATLRSVQWTHVWHRAALKVNSPSRPFLHRRIVNRIITEFPNIHSLLPCKLINICKTDITSQCEDFFNLTNSYFVVLKDLRGKVCQNRRNYYSVEKNVNIRNSVTMMKDDKQPKPLGNKKKLSRGRLCRMLREDSTINYPTRLFHTGGYYKPKSKYETTLVTQLSINRLEMFVKLLHHWNGPVSITMYGNDTEVWNVIEFLNRSGFVKRRNLAVHFVLKQALFYPVNFLRNIALSNVKTDYVFLNDADFLPSFGLYERLLVYNKYLMRDSPKRALVIPAFQTVETNYTSVYPPDKETLLHEINNTRVTTFCPKCKHQTHAPTRYKQWYSALEPYKIDWAFHFEPYVVVRSDVVSYSRLFMGYGWNKVSQITELKARKYEFVVIPDHFIVHMPHKSSTDKSIWNLGAFKYCINRVWKKFMIVLKEKYGLHCLAENQDASTTIYHNFESL